MADTGKPQQHTPGPWRITPDGYVSSDEGYVQILTPFRERAFEPDDASSEHRPRALANAALIAAAPELLGALVELASLTKRANAMQHAGAHVPAELWGDLYAAELTARAAIAKATP
jgi:hypothetical protein